MKNHINFKSALALGVLSAIGLGAQAQTASQDVGRVISSTPIISQVAVPRQVCAQEVVQVQNQIPATKSGGGALMGGIAGGALGNAVGQGSGRAAATIIGIFGGAILGDRIEGGSPAQVATTQQTVNRCSTQNMLENRTTAYQVVYEYAGKQYSVQLPNDPGPTIPLQIAPAVPVLPAPTAPRVMSQAEPVPTVITDATVYQPYVVAAPVVVAPPPVYYYPNPVFSTSLIIGGRIGHGHGHGHGHVRSGHRSGHRYY